MRANKKFTSVSALGKRFRGPVAGVMCRVDNSPGKLHECHECNTAVDVNN